jgi:hypothetical protein
MTQTQISFISATVVVTAIYASVNWGPSRARRKLLNALVKDGRLTQAEANVILHGEPTVIKPKSPKELHREFQLKTGVIVTALIIGSIVIFVSLIQSGLLISEP